GCSGDGGSDQEGLPAEILCADSQQRLRRRKAAAPARTGCVVRGDSRGAAAANGRGADRGQGRARRTEDRATCDRSGKGRGGGKTATRPNARLARSALV